MDSKAIDGELAVADNDPSLHSLIRTWQGKSAKGLARDIEAMILSGELVPATRLPTVRDIAKLACLSTGTVADAFKQLRTRGYVSTHKRGGTVVSSLLPALPDESVHAPDIWRSIDLIYGSSDKALLPDMREPLLAVLDTPSLHSVVREEFTAPLREAVGKIWPFPAQAWTIAGGGTESMLLAIEAAAPRGSSVLLDEPMAPGMLDTVRELGLQPVGLPSDEQGLLPAALEQALQGNPAALILQPPSPFAMHGAYTQARLDQMEAILKKAGAIPWIIEEDALGPLAPNRLTLGNAFPDSLVRMSSFCRPYGADLRNSVMGGSAELVRRIQKKRSHGVAVNSRILQNLLAQLIMRPEADKSVYRARQRYALRRNGFLAALSQAGLPASASANGLVVWVQVKNAELAIESLARDGVVVGNGLRSFSTPPAQNYLRIGITHLPDDPRLQRDLARLIADADLRNDREYAD